MSRRHSHPDDVVRCRAHQLPERTCRYCAIDDLHDLLERVRLAVRAGRSSAVRDSYVSGGGSASWEPINLAAIALGEDVRAAGGLTHGDDGQVLSWRDRARIILGDAFAPFPVLGEHDPQTGRSRLVRCPTCLERHGHDDQQPVGTLLVQRDADPASPTYARVHTVTCSRNRDHSWAYAYGGFLRLKAAMLAAAE